MKDTRTPVEQFSDSVDRVFSFYKKCLIFLFVFFAVLSVIIVPHLMG